MAIFLRSPFEYRPHLEEALRRAEIPAFFARGATRPDPSGRALLALLACASEGLSARGFAEYLSLGQVPDPVALRDPGRAFVAPAHDLLPEDLDGAGHDAADAADTASAAPRAAEPGPGRDPEEAPVVEGSVREPWRWEKLLVDASVIGRKDRWARRLAGLEAELELRRSALEDDAGASRAAYLDRQIRDLRHLRETALPLIDRLASLPAGGTWGAWLEHLRGLAIAALRAPEGVLATLAEIDPMAPIGPVDLDEVQIVLGPRLRELTEPPPRRRYGRVFIAPAESAHGVSFDVVFVPGLAEKLFPRKIIEDPLLPDPLRERLSPDLETQSARADAERLALRAIAPREAAQRSGGRTLPEFCSARCFAGGVLAAVRRHTDCPWVLLYVGRWLKAPAAPGKCGNRRCCSKRFSSASLMGGMSLLFQPESTRTISPPARSPAKTIRWCSPAPWTGCLTRTRFCFLPGKFAVESRSRFPA
jgi:hypothetical protein